MKTKIKICGITRVADATYAVSAGADYLGMIFAESPRQVDVERAQEIRDVVPNAMLVGVFVDGAIEDVVATAEMCGLDLIQLHGEETPEYCEQLRSDTGKPIIKAFRATRMPDTSELSKFETTSYFLFDLDKSHLEEERLPRLVSEMWKHTDRKRRKGFRMFLAGALDTANVREAIKKTNAYCVDVCRGVEELPGVKDHEAIKNFIAEVRR